MNIWKCTTAALALSLGLVISGGVVTSASAEPQPRMAEALGHLQRAEAALQAASADKGGHRARAIEATRAAIAETRAGIEFDNRH